MQLVVAFDPGGSGVTPTQVIGRVADHPDPAELVYQPGGNGGVGLDNVVVIHMTGHRVGRSATSHTPGHIIECMPEVDRRRVEHTSHLHLFIGIERSFRMNEDREFIILPHGIKLTPPHAVVGSLADSFHHRDQVGMRLGESGFVGDFHRI